VSLFTLGFHSLCGVRSTYRARSIRLQPLVDASRVKLVTARQRTEELSTLEVAHADDARRLIEKRATYLLVEAVTRQQIDVAFRQSSWFRFTKPIRKIEQRLIIVQIGTVLV
jgi:hypothetical protein